MNQRDFLLTKINSGKAELEQMPAFMQIEREYLQADIKEWEEELAKIPPGPNGEKIYFLNRQINAAKDYLRRLHPRFTEERKQREEWIQEKEAELMKLEKENGVKTPQLEPCPFCGSMPVEYNGCIRCEAPDCYVQPGVKSEIPEFLLQLWNAMAMIESEDEKQESDKFHQPYLNPCVRCGGLGLFEGKFTGGRAWCYSCDNEIIFKGKVTPQEIIGAWNEENPIPNPCDKCGIPPKRRNDPGLAIVYCPECLKSSVENDMTEAVNRWNKQNPLKTESAEEQKPATQTPPKFSQVMKEIEQRIPVKLLDKLYLLNSILGLQRDEKGPVIEVKKIQETILEIDRTLQKGEIWRNDEAISELTKQSEEMKSDEYLAPSENRKIAVHGSVYVTALHIAGAVCSEAEMYAWEYEQKHGIGVISQVSKYLGQLAEWLFVRAEYLKNTEECF